MGRLVEVTLCVSLLLASSTSQARDPAFAAQARCKGKSSCAALKSHLKRLKKTASGKGAQAQKAQFVFGSVQGAEALRTRNKKLAAQAVEALKPVAKLGASHRLADDALVLIARLRWMRGAKKRAAKTLNQVLCEFPKADMRKRSTILLKRWNYSVKKCAGAQPKTAAKASAPKKSKTAKALPPPVVLGPVTASGGKMTASLRRVKRIVLDPGHGGDDPGAVGLGGVHEADLAYDLTVSVAEVLRTRGYQVLMTRGRSQGRTLRQRTEYANRHRADLFISIHLNAAKRRAYGFEVYYLDVGADRYARRLAARENRQSVEEVDALRFILADLAMKGNAVDSRLLASELTDAVNGFRTNRKQEVRSALFAVLLGARMPAVLIEAGFVTDKDDVKRMKKEKRRLATAKFLADGIDAFAKKMALERQ